MLGLCSDLKKSIGPESHEKKIEDAVLAARPLTFKRNFRTPIKINTSPLEGLHPFFECVHYIFLKISWPGPKNGLIRQALQQGSLTLREGFYGK